MRTKDIERRTTLRTKASEWGKVLLEKAVRRDAAPYGFSALAFFMGRATIPGELNPVVIAYLAPFLARGNALYAACIFSVLGILTKYNHFYSMKHIMAICAVATLRLVFSRGLWKNAKSAGPIWSAGIVSAVLLASGLLFAIANGFSAYLGAVAVVECALSFGFGLVFARFTRLAFDTPKKRLGKEELISLAVICGAVMTGAADIYAGALSLRLMSAALVTLVLSRGGAAAGATAGLVTGVMMFAAGYEPLTFAAALAAGGLAAGAVNARDGWGNKFIVTAAFLAAAGAFGLYAGYRFQTAAVSAVSLTAATLVFWAVKPDALMKLPLLSRGNYFDKGTIYAEKAAEIAKVKLERYSEALGKLSKSFDKLAERKTAFTRSDAMCVIDDTAARVCVDCAKCDGCWGTRDSAAMDEAIRAVAACERAGKAEITAAWRELCPNSAYFVTTLNRCFELYRAGLAWKNKLAENRKLISEQMRGVSAAVSGLAAELSDDLTFLDEYAENVRAELSRSNIIPDSVVASESAGLLTVRADLPAPIAAGSARERELIGAVGRAVKRKMRVSERYDRNLTLTERFDVTAAYSVSRLARDEGGVNGDCFSVMEFPDGRFVAALSDGMGFGERAWRESNAAISLLEELTEAGFNIDAAMRLINSSLMLKNPDDTFTTMDVCYIDAKEATAEFIKSGASTSFVVHLPADGGKTEVETFSSVSLPAGIVESFDADKAVRGINDGDLIVMVTDGVLDSAVFAHDKESWITELLENLPDDADTQTVADAVLEQAVANYGIQPRDDMTVVSIRIRIRK